MSNESLLAMVNMDKMLNDLLDILASLDGRVKRLEIKNSIKKRPSYLSVVGNNEKSSLYDDIKLEQTQHSLSLLGTAVKEIDTRIQILEDKKYLHG